MPNSLEHLDEVDWPSLTHAYGDAGDVPGLLRDLAADDAETREEALDSLLGGVHHQGDIYDSTVAALPFLCAIAADPAVGDRDAVLRLLDSIGETVRVAIEEAGDDVPDPRAVIAAEDPEEWSDALMLAYALLGGEVLRAHLEPLTALLADAEPAVRGAVAGLLARRAAAPERVLGALVARVDAEADGGVRQELASALAALAQRMPTLTEAAESTSSGPAEALLRLAVPDEDPGTVLAALAGLARHAAARLPADTAERAGAALGRLRAAPPDAAPAEPRPATNTMISYLRDLSGASSDPDDRAGEALSGLHGALGDQVGIRHRLVLHELASLDRATAAAALDRVWNLYNGWRVPGAERMVGPLLPYITAADPKLSARVLSTLRWSRPPWLPELLDTTAALAEAAMREGVTGWSHGPAGACADLLGAAGDPRAVEVYAALLRGGGAAEDLPDVVARLGPRGRELIPVLRDRLEARLSGLDYSGERWPLDTAATFMAALLAAGDTDVTPMLPLLTAVADRAEANGTPLGAGRTLLSRPGGLGPDAGAAVPVLRRLLDDPDGDARVRAARALWHAGEDAVTLLPTLVAALADADDWYACRQALDLVAAMGTAAEPLAPSIRVLVAEAGHVRAALALRAVAPHDAPAADEPLRAGWLGRRETRRDIAAGLRREHDGPPLPAGFDALLRAELAEPRRVGNDRDRQGGGFRHNADADDTLRENCRFLLGGAGAGRPA